MKYAPMVTFWCPVTGSIFRARQEALAKAYSELSKSYEKYEAPLALIDDWFDVQKSKRPWPRKRSKKFHQMRVGA